MAKTLRRPTKGMMFAVNAKIDGKTADVNKLIKEYKLSTAEVKRRVEIRDGEKYNLKKKGGRPKGSAKKISRGPGRAPAAAARGEDLMSVMDGRTKTATLLRISYRANELLDTKRKAEVQKVEKAMEQAEKLKKQYEEALKVIGEEPPI